MALHVKLVKEVDWKSEVSWHENKSKCICTYIYKFSPFSSIQSVRQFTTRILEFEQRIHILINNANIQWVPLRRTAEGHEYHWGYNHLAHFAMTQLLMPLLLRYEIYVTYYVTLQKYNVCSQLNALEANETRYKICHILGMHLGKLWFSKAIIWEQTSYFRRVIYTTLMEEKKVIVFKKYVHMYLWYVHTNRIQWCNDIKNVIIHSFVWRARYIFLSISC